MERRSELTGIELAHPHEMGTAQSWEIVDRDVRAYVEGVVKTIADSPESAGFVGAYLHGSLASGSFYRGKSDIDLALVVSSSLSAASRRTTTERLAELSDRRPTTGDIEVAVVNIDVASAFNPPVQCEVLYSETDKPAIHRGEIDYSTSRVDESAAAHFFNIRSTGVVLTGSPIDDVFGEVPIEVFRETARADLDWILDEENILSTPIYGVLNCCRWLANQANDWHEAMSKDQAGSWALRALPEIQRPVVGQAIACYRSSEHVEAAERRTDGHSWSESQVLRFRDYVREEASRRAA